MTTPPCSEFEDSDTEYLEWLAEHPEGFVVNTGRNRSADYMVLHRAACTFISRPFRETAPGGFTERALIKICADEVPALRQWVKEHGRPDGTFSKECSICKPTT
jgi:hypothetical protein